MSALFSWRQAHLPRRVHQALLLHAAPVHPLPPLTPPRPAASSAAEGCSGNEERRKRLLTFSFPACLYHFVPLLLSCVCPPPFPHPSPPPQRRQACWMSPVMLSFCFSVGVVLKRPRSCRHGSGLASCAECVLSLAFSLRPPLALCLPRDLDLLLTFSSLALPFFGAHAMSGRNVVRRMGYQRVALEMGQHLYD